MNRKKVWFVTGASKGLGLTLVKKLLADGYKEEFTVTDNLLKALSTGKQYTPAEVKIINFFRFEGQTDPADSSIMYVLETQDGTKGTLVDAYGIYSDPEIDKFMKAVESIQKDANTSTNTNAC